MPAPDPDTVYARAEREGDRRLHAPPLEQVATAFIAMLSTAGNVAGGLLLITLTHTAQVKGGKR